MEMLRSFFRDEEGANLVEYALLITFIAILVIVGVGFLGAQINDWFSQMGRTVNTWAANVSQ
jgi:pilus assembly protein Flp/PilA